MLMPHVPSPAYRKYVLSSDIAEQHVLTIFSFAHFQPVSDLCYLQNKQYANALCSLGCIQRVLDHLS